MRESIQYNDGMPLSLLGSSGVATRLAIPRIYHFLTVRGRRIFTAAESPRNR
jgi:hypothetical protein